MIKMQKVFLALSRLRIPDKACVEVTDITDGVSVILRLGIDPINLLVPDYILNLDVDQIVNYIGAEWNPHFLNRGGE
jgi:hypothetical protein